MIIYLFLILVLTNVIKGNHFNGGTITWAPVFPTSNSSSILITVTQSYSWVYPTVNCTKNIPYTNWFGTLVPSNDDLVCVANCSTQGGYASNPISILTDCTSYSASLGMLSTERSVNITLNVSTYFWIAYKGSAWRSIENTASSTPDWSIVSLIDLRRRPDGLINTPPEAQVTSPQYVIVNRTTSIRIPVSDVNSGDDLRCRWSSKSSPYGVDECADVCPSGTVTNLGNISDCMLTFTASKSGVWYAIALQVEDFINTTSTMPMSSVVVQFLIYVLPAPNCSQAPVIIPLIGCLEVEVNVPVTFTLFAMNYCNRTRTIITDLLPTVDINGMNVSSLSNSTTNTSLVFVTLTWTPQSNQIGQQEFCAVAYTNEKVQSNLYCVKFTVTILKPCTTTTTSTTSSSTSTSTSTTSATTTTTTTSKTTTTTSVTTISSTTSTSSTTSRTTTTTTTTQTTTSTTSTTTSTTSTTTSTTTTTSTQTTTTTTTTSTTSTSTSTSTTTSKTTTTTTTTQTTTTTSTTTTSTQTTTTTTTTSTTSTSTSTTTTTSQTTTTTTTTQTTTTTSSTSTSTTSTTTSVTTTSTSTSTTSTSTSTSTTTSQTTTTTTTTQTTTTTSSTSTTTTSTQTTTTTTQTTTTATTTTTQTTTSVTSTTLTTTTTTKASNANEINIQLIVGLSILGLFLSLCCAGSCLYYLKWKKNSRRRRLNRDFQNGADEVSRVEDLMISRRSKRSKTYISDSGTNVQRLFKKISAKNSVGTTRTGDNEEKISEKSSMKSLQEQEINRSMLVGEKSAKSQHSTIVNRVKKTISNSDTIRDNDSNKSITFHEEINEGSTVPSSSHVHIVKLPRNKVSAHSKPRAMTTTTAEDSTFRQQRNLDGKNNILGEISLSRIDPKVSTTNSSFRSHRNDNVNNSNRREKSKKSRRRPSSFNGVEVSQMKPTHENDNVWINHPRSAVFSKDKNMDVNNRVTVVSVMKL